MAPPDLSDSVVALPGGLIAADGRRLARAELRPLTGAEEEWLAARPSEPSAPAVTRLLAACVVRLDGVPADRELARRLLVGDRDYLMLQLRRLTLGDQVRAVVPCPACREKMDVEFAGADVPVEARPQTAAAYALACGGRTIRFRLPTGGDQETVVGLSAPAAAAALLDQCLMDDGGSPLTADDRAAVTEAMGRLAPRVEADLALTCPACGHAFEAPFDTTAFFLHEMRAGGKRLLRETHLLAFHYHWSQAEILSLRRDRRHAYLALLSDELRPG